MSEGRQRSAQALEHLTDALDRDAFATVLVTSPVRGSCLTVVCRATLVTEHIYANDDGWFRWSWSERLATTNDPIGAAHQVSMVLHGGPAASGQR